VAGSGPSVRVKLTPPKLKAQPAITWSHSPTRRMAYQPTNSWGIARAAPRRPRSSPGPRLPNGCPRPHIRHVLAVAARHSFCGQSQNGLGASDKPRPPRTRRGTVPGWAPWASSSERARLSLPPPRPRRHPPAPAPGTPLRPSGGASPRGPAACSCSAALAVSEDPRPPHSPNSAPTSASSSVAGTGRTGRRVAFSLQAEPMLHTDRRWPILL
jgi:hypothetical protein